MIGLGVERAGGRIDSAADAADLILDRRRMVPSAPRVERNESDLLVADPFTGEVKRKLHSIYPNNSGVLSTAGSVIFTGYTDGTFAAYDDTTLDQLWKINVGTGFTAPPMTFEVGGKQYVAILSGLSRASRNRHNFTPELREMRNQTMLFVFGL